MERHGISEREAFERLRAYARSRSLPVVDVSRAVSEGHGLLPAGDRAEEPGD
jgi:AmiR/NasT family two-component response regulator